MYAIVYLGACERILDIEAGLAHNVSVISQIGGGDPFTHSPLSLSTTNSVHPQGVRDPGAAAPGHLRVRGLLRALPACTTTTHTLHTPFSRPLSLLESMEKISKA